MKKILLLTLALMALALPASAQQYSATTLTVTNAVPASTTTTTTPTITLTKHDQVAITVAFAGLDVDTGDVTFSLAQGIDGTNYDTTKAYTIVVPSNGTNTVRFTTNYTINAVGYLKLKSIQNAATNAITNIVVKYSLKPKRQG